MTCLFLSFLDTLLSNLRVRSPKCIIDFHGDQWSCRKRKFVTCSNTTKPKQQQQCKMDTTNDDPMTAAMLNATTSTTNTLSMAAEGLSDAQEKVLAILPIPSAILSIFGSATILYMCCRTRNERKWTTYTRLLIGLSICDILSSLTLGVAAFLRPRDNLRVWTFGNEATCSAIGFLTQFSYSGLFYNAMLSFYFLLSARFRIKNERIAKRIEPFMHFLSLLFPLVTASVGAEMGVYSTTTSELG